MKRSFSTAAQGLLQAAWRRRYLLLIPLIVMVPIGVVASLYLPQAFVARSLLLLQEEGRENPLARTTPSPAAMAAAQERLSGLRALLFSDAILSKVAEDFGARTERDKASVIQALQQTLKLDMLGPEFLEFRLVSARREGLGRRLETIMTRFLEGLMPDGAGISAQEMLREGRRRDVKALASAQNSLETRAKSVLPQGLEEAKSELTDVNSRATSAAEFARTTSEEIDFISQSLGFSSRAQLQQGLSQALESSATNSERRNQLTQLKVALSREAAIRKESSQLEQRAEELRRSISEHGDLVLQAQKAKEAVEAGELALTRNDGRVTASQVRGTPVGLLRSPELIRVIDAPADPEFPSITRFIYLLAASGAGIALGIALAFLAELLDSTLRSAEEIAEVAGAPVVAKLPRFEPRGLIRNGRASGAE